MANSRLSFSVAGCDVLKVRKRDLFLPFDDLPKTG